MAYFKFAKNTISCYRERFYGFGPSWKFNTEETLHKNTAIFCNNIGHSQQPKLFVIFRIYHGRLSIVFSITIKE